MAKIVRVEDIGHQAEVEYETEIMDDETNLVPATMTLKCTHEGMIVDITDPETGEIIRTGYLLLDDLIEITR